MSKDLLVLRSLVSLMRPYRNPMHVRTLPDPLQRTVVEYCRTNDIICLAPLLTATTGLNSRTRVLGDDMALDTRFASEAQCSPYRAVICLPIQSNRGQTIGALYLASRYSFLQSTVDVLCLFLQQASTRYNFEPVSGMKLIPTSLAFPLQHLERSSLPFRPGW